MLFKYPIKYGFFSVIPEKREEVLYSTLWEKPKYSFSIFFNLGRGNIKKCLEVIAKFEELEQFSPQDDAEKIAKIVFGEDAIKKIDYGRYEDLIKPIIYKMVRAKENKLNICLDEKVNIRFLYYSKNYTENRAKDFIASIFLKMPRLFNDDFIKLVKTRLKTFRKSEKRQRALEFIHFIDRDSSSTVKNLTKKCFHKWTMPSVKIKDRPGEIDVLCIYLLKHRAPLIDLIECSVDQSSNKELEAREQLRQKNYSIRQRFGKQLKVRNFFNDKEISIQL